MLNDVIIRYNRVYEGWKRDEIGEHFVRTLGSPRSDMNDWLSLGRGMPVEQNWSSSRLQTCECFASDHIDMYTREWGFTFCIVDVILYIKRPDPNRNDPAFVQGLADLQLSRGPLKWWRGEAIYARPTVSVLSQRGAITGGRLWQVDAPLCPQGYVAIGRALGRYTPRNTYIVSSTQT